MPDRGADGAYTYMVPGSANEWDTFQQQTYQCYIHPYYTLVKWDARHTDPINAQTYYPMTYMNKTDGFEEYICLNNDDFIDPDSCNHNSIVPTEAYYTALYDSLAVSDENYIQYITRYVAVGCKDCATGYIPIVNYDDVFGIYHQECISKNNYDWESANVPCEKLGQSQ